MPPGLVSFLAAFGGRAGVRGRREGLVTSIAVISFSYSAETKIEEGSSEAVKDIGAGGLRILSDAPDDSDVPLARPSVPYLPFTGVGGGPRHRRFSQNNASEPLGETTGDSPAARPT